MLWLTLLLVPAAQTDPVGAGAKIFAANCAIGYCHGAGGSAGRAPRIQGREFTPEYLFKVTREGIPGTAMPPWRDRLNEAEIQAVVAYMLSISARPETGAATPQQGESAGRLEPPEVRRGRALFFDAVRGTRCGTCHALENRGIPVGPNLAAAPVRTVGELRSPKPTSVVNLRLSDGSEFPALVVEESGDLVRVYDLTVAPPVLRTLPRAQVRLGESGAWSHASAVATYSDRELEAILSYLEWVRTALSGPEQ